MPPDNPFLTELQLAVLRVLWERGHATAADVTEALRPARALAQTTVATVLSRLEKRGVVEHEVVARQFLYRPCLTEAEATGSMVSALTERLFDGDATALVSHLLSARDFSRGDLARVKTLIASRETRKDGSR